MKFKQLLEETLFSSLLKSPTKDSISHDNKIDSSNLLFNETVSNYENEISNVDENVLKEETTPLHNNIACQTMIECCCQILEYVENQEKYKNTDLNEIHCYIEQLIFEYIVRIGGELINKDTEFMPVRHKPIENKFINPGTPIEILSPGVLLLDKVLIKAKVRPVVTGLEI